MNKLKYLRKLNNKTQNEIAQILKMTNANYGRIENEKQEIPKEVLIKLAKYYDVSTDYILGIDNTNTEKKLEELSYQQIISLIKKTELPMQKLINIPPKKLEQLIKIAKIILDD